MAKVLISIEDHVLRRIDRAAKARGLSRSAYLAGLATEALRRERGPGASKESRDALRRIDRLVEKNGTPGGDSTEVVRGLRDSR